jgi:hypothetical protein
MAYGRERIKRQGRQPCWDSYLQPVLFCSWRITPTLKLQTWTRRNASK